jgi:hypothetical protein
MVQDSETRLMLKEVGTLFSPWSFLSLLLASAIFMHHVAPELVSLHMVVQLCQGSLTMPRNNRHEYAPFLLYGFAAEQSC